MNNILTLKFIKNIWTKYHGANPSSYSCCVITGSFDPPTKAHLMFISQATKFLDKNGKIYILINSSGSKHYFASVSQRIEMLKLLTKNSDIFEIKSQTQETKYSTLKQLCRKHEGKICSVIGEDSFNTLPKKTLKLNIKWIVIRRLGWEKIQTEAYDIPDNDTNKISVHTIKGYKNVSSSRVRSAISLGLNIKNILTPPVLKYIEIENLYHGLPISVRPLQEQLYKESFVSFVRDLKLRHPFF